MGIDINLLRIDRGGDPDQVRESEKRRGRDPALVDQVIQKDEAWRHELFQLESLKKKLNALSKSIGQCYKQKQDATTLKTEAADVKQQLPILENRVQEIRNARDTLLASIGNLVHSSVPVHNDENFNTVLRSWPGIHAQRRIESCKKILHHHEILLKLGGVDFRKGAEVAGHRGYFLKGVGVLLNMALVNYGLQFLVSRGYTPVQPPFFMKRNIISETAELKDFNETLYKIPGNLKDGHSVEHAAKSDSVTLSDDQDLFLIATSEQPLCSLHRKEWLSKEQLPILYTGVSTCFRKEAGAHGQDTWGIFRVHQFEKVEQFCITTPDQSEDMHEKMVEISECFYQSLDIPYRLISIVSGALNDAASKKIDLEAHFPGYNDYKELVSCSNCTDYQSRDSEIRLEHKKQSDDTKNYVHLLNATLVASQRCLCCILENYQTDDGVRVPTPLVPYMGGITFMDYKE